MSSIGRRRTLLRQNRRQRKRYHIRHRVTGTEERPRLSVSKSLRYIYAQVINDADGTTLAQANSLESAVRSQVSGGTSNKGAAEAVGKLVAERALDKGVKKVVFDRGGFVYHGKIKALADAAREGGLEF